MVGLRHRANRRVHFHAFESRSSAAEALASTMDARLT
jgi:hypothetical protein